eukprot:9447298-Alexandrium_andersonii.AAC.1
MGAILATMTRNEEPAWRTKCRRGNKQSKRRRGVVDFVSAHPSGSIPTSVPWFAMSGLSSSVGH